MQTDEFIKDMFTKFKRRNSEKDPLMSSKEQRYLSKYKDLKKNVRELNQTNVALEKLNKDLHNKFKILEKNCKPSVIKVTK